MSDKLHSIYVKLLAFYGNPHWWPARTPYEVIVGSILTQNTAWSNVEKAIANFGDGLTPEAVAIADVAKLKEIIHPAGFFNQKAVYLKAVTAWFGRYGYDVAAVRREPFEKLRAELLATKGVGMETADSILLYAFELPTFPVDAYTLRLCRRYPIAAGTGYEAVRAYFQEGLEPSIEVYNNFHALIVLNAKSFCRSKPVCDGRLAEGCPLMETCGRCDNPADSH
ncbi:MAG: endonuclease [Peptococcaceae bacterium]|nr:endonuclease [Peptococcaceae bacterium]